MVRMAVLGGTGYLGSHVVTYALASGVDSSAVAMPRVEDLVPGSVPLAAASWERENADAFRTLCHALEPFDIVVNAAGAARPGSADSRSLFSANAVLPLIAARAAGIAGVRRFIHISTAAVQGRLDPLDESERHIPLTPYGRTKSQGESALLRSQETDRDAGPMPPEVTIYRPTSVHGQGHGATVALARMVARLPVVPLGGNGSQILPVTLVENVAAGVVFAAGMPTAERIILQPSEDVTARQLVGLFGARRVMAVPSVISGPALDRVARISAPRPALEARIRWLEILLRGQAVDANVLADAGFSAPLGLDAWRALAYDMSVQCRLTIRPQSLHRV